MALAIWLPWSCENDPFTRKNSRVITIVLFFFNSGQKYFAFIMFCSLVLKYKKCALRPCNNRQTFMEAPLYDLCLSPLGN